MLFSLFETWGCALAQAFPLTDQSVEILHQQMATNAQLTWLDFDIYKSCQLTCNHCFYNDNYPRSQAPALQAGVVKRSHPASIGCANPRADVQRHGADFVEKLRLGDSSRAPCAHRIRASAKIGLITNGLTLPQHRQFLEQEPPDFIDVSLDGWEYQNLIRSNNRDRVLANVRLVKKELRATRVVTSTVLRNYNICDFITMIERLADWNEYFYFEPVVAAVDKPVLSLSSENLLFFVTLLRGLAEKLRQRPLRFSILLNGDQALPLFCRGVIEPEQIEEDDLHSLYIRQEFGKAQIDYILRIVPEYYWRSAQLTYDGYWLGSCDLLQAPDFREVASGNFVKTPDVQKLFHDSLQRDGMFHGFLQELSRYSCGHTPREWLRCFRYRLRLNSENRMIRI